MQRKYKTLLHKKHRGIQITHYMKFIPLVVLYKNYKAGLLYINRQVYTAVHICHQIRAITVLTNTLGA